MSPYRLLMPLTLRGVLIVLLQFFIISTNQVTARTYGQNLNKLYKNLNERQHDLVKSHPGSIVAVARALKLAIHQCQHQMRDEPWDCPIYGFSIKPNEIFGNLMSRSFKETSFIHSLLSSAIAHSIARACTESMITTCHNKGTRDGGFRENIEFGREFAQEFMEATHEVPPFSSSTLNNNANLNNNIINTGNGGAGSSGDVSVVARHPHNQNHHGTAATSGGTGLMVEPTMSKERKIRKMINVHNDEVGRLLVLNGMRRECKCHGLSGACSMQTCWLRLPPFEEVANKLHDSLDQAVRVIYVAHTPMKKSLTSASVKKSNKKRSSSAQPVSGLTRSSALVAASNSISASSNSHSYPLPAPSYSLTSADFIGSRQKKTRRHSSSTDTECEDCYRSPVAASNNGTITTSAPQRDDSGGDQPSPSPSPSPARDPISKASNSTATNAVKKRPVARSIGLATYTISPSKFDLLYYEESPDFCVPSERYNIKGTRGRICSENQNASNSCERLCCGRGYKTEVRDEKYNCKCQFKFCCKLDCSTCKKRTITHKCL